MFKKDNLIFGLILGIISPVIGWIAYYFIQFRLFSFQEYIDVMLRQKSLLTAMLSLALLANALVFTLYTNSKKDKTARGVFISTCLYAILVLLIKWLY